MAKRVGFVGVGAMGEPMAASLLRAGFTVTVCAHRNRAPVERLVALGATDGGDDYSSAAQFYQRAAAVQVVTK